VQYPFAIGTVAVETHELGDGKDGAAEKNCSQKGLPSTKGVLGLR
jgi:hypothetical protein